MDPEYFAPVFKKLKEIENENEKKSQNFYPERPVHPDVEKCFVCEEKGPNTVKWDKALGWQLLKEHYEEHAKVDWVRAQKKEGRLNKKMMSFDKFLPWTEDSYLTNEFRGQWKKYLHPKYKKVLEHINRLNESSSSEVSEVSEESDVEETNTTSYEPSGNSSDHPLSPEPVQTINDSDDEVFSSFRENLKTKDEKEKDKYRYAPLDCKFGGPHCRKFSRQKDASLHFKLYHSKYHSEVCEKCKRRFETHSELRSHQKKCDPDRRFELKEVNEPVSGSTGKTRERRKRKRMSRIYASSSESESSDVVIRSGEDEVLINPPSDSSSTPEDFESPNSENDPELQEALLISHQMNRTQLEKSAEEKCRASSQKGNKIVKPSHVTVETTITPPVLTAVKSKTVEEANEPKLISSTDSTKTFNSSKTQLKTAKPKKQTEQSVTVKDKKPEAILAISSSEESSTKSENEKRKSKKSKKRKDKKKEHERSPEHDEDDIPLDQMIKVHIDQEANEALEGSGFQSGVFTYDVHKKAAEKFAKAPKICIWCEKDFECEFCPSTKEYREKFLTHMQTCLRDQTFII